MVSSGGRLPIPEYVSHTLSQIITLAWNKEPYERPPFQRIVSILNEAIGKDDLSRLPPEDLEKTEIIIVPCIEASPYTSSSSSQSSTREEQPATSSAIIVAPQNDSSISSVTVSTATIVTR